MRGISTQVQVPVLRKQIESGLYELSPAGPLQRGESVRGAYRPTRFRRSGLLDREREKERS